MSVVSAASCENISRNSISGSTGYLPSVQMSNEQGPRTTLTREAADACNRYVEQYRSRSITFASAVASIAVSLLSQSINQRELEKHLIPYIDSLKVADQTAAARQLTPKVKVAPTTASPATEGRLVEGARGHPTVGRRRSASPEQRARGEGGRYIEDSQRRDYAHSKANNLKYAWLQDGDEPVWDLTYSVARRTHELRVVYERDIEAAAQSLFASYERPRFPSGHWRHVLSGRFMDLDKLREDMHSLNACDSDIIPLGEGIDIRVKRTISRAKADTVINLDTWLDVWDQYADAVAFAFPMRESELNSYRGWIDNLFCSVKTPRRVITLDKVIRREVSDNPRLSLDDFKKWNQYKFIHLM